MVADLLAHNSHDITCIILFITWHNEPIYNDEKDL